MIFLQTVFASDDRQNLLKIDHSHILLYRLLPLPTSIFPLTGMMLRKPAKIRVELRKQFLGPYRMKKIVVNDDNEEHYWKLVGRIGRKK